MEAVLAKYLPEHSIPLIVHLIKQHHVHLKIVNERHTRHGDYRRNPDGSHQITVNCNLNPYRFLMTTVHEIAHLVAFETYGRNIKPHGDEWKHTFQKLMLPFLHPAIFPSQLLPLLARHFKNPAASSDTDATLAMALKSFDPPSDKNYIFEIPYGAYFRTANGRIFQRGAQRTKRFECRDLQNGQVYLFAPNAEIELLPDPKGM